MTPHSDGGESAPQGDQPKKRTRRRRRRRKSTGRRSEQGQLRQTSGAKPKEAKRTGADPKGADAKRTDAKRTRRRRPGRRAKATDKAKSQPSRKSERKKAPQKRPKIPTTREVSAGGVLYRRGDDGIEVVLASRRTRRGQLAWGLAKGGIERGESKEQAAIREVREETGLTADIEADLGDTRYIYVWDEIRIRKTVHFFLMRHTGGDVDDRDDEMEEIRWFPLERALKRAAYRGERDVLGRAAELLR
jgi:8-oxo-dGTP pyrophosphatase MutT (NUDIX family)